MLEVGIVEPNDPSSLMAKLNRSTPHAPGDADEAAERVAAARSVPSASNAGAGDIASRSPQGPGEEAPTGLSRVFVPTVHPVEPGENPEYQLRAMEGGRAGIAVYTSVDRLKECLGDDQPWSEASLLELLYLVGKRRFAVALNPHLDLDLVAAPTTPGTDS